MPSSLPLELGWTSASPFPPGPTMVGEIRGKLGVDVRNRKYIFTELWMGYWMPQGETPSEESSATS